MAVFRVEKNRGYTVMSNHHLRNESLTLKAKGLLSQMLSLPETWDYNLIIQLLFPYGTLATRRKAAENNPLLFLIVGVLSDYSGYENKRKTSYALATCYQDSFIASPRFLRGGFGDVCLLSCFIQRCSVAQIKAAIAETTKAPKRITSHSGIERSWR